MAGTKQTPNPLEITFAKVRTWTSHDGGGYQGEILTSGTPVAWMHNDGNGGPTSIEPIFVRGKAKPGYEAFTRALAEAIKTIPPQTYEGMVLPWSPDFYIDTLYSQWEVTSKLAKSVERAKKSGAFLYRLDKDDERTAFRTLKATGRTIKEAEGVEYLNKKYGPNGWTVL